MMTTEITRPERTTTAGRWYLERSGLEDLVAALRADGRTVIGPTVADGAIVYDEIRGAGELPHGMGDVQAAGRYRLTRRDDARVFGYVVGPTSWKRWVFPPTIELNTGRRATVRPGAGWRGSAPWRRSSSSSRVSGSLRAAVVRLLLRFRQPRL